LLESLVVALRCRLELLRSRLRSQLNGQLRSQLQSKVCSCSLPGTCDCNDPVFSGDGFVELNESIGLNA
jgi:hypothetical protein